MLRPYWLVVILRGCKFTISKYIVFDVHWREIRFIIIFLKRAFSQVIQSGKPRAFVRIRSVLIAANYNVTVSKFIGGNSATMHDSDNQGAGRLSMRGVLSVKRAPH